MISEDKEKQLVAAGRLTKEKQLLKKASRVMDRIEERGSITAHSVKPR
jgi:hypothetical protein